MATKPPLIHPSSPRIRPAIGPTRPVALGRFIDFQTPHRILQWLLVLLVPILRLGRVADGDGGRLPALACFDDDVRD